MTIDQLLTMCEVVIDQSESRGVTARGLAVPLALGQLRRFVKGDIVSHQGTVAEELIVVLKGSIEIVWTDDQGGQHVLRSLDSPCLAGARSILDRGPHATSCRVRSEAGATAIALDRYTVEDLYSAPDEVGSSLRHFIGAHLARAVETTASGAVAKARTTQVRKRPPPAQKPRPGSNDGLEDLAYLVEGWDIDLDSLDQVEVVQTEQETRRATKYSQR